MTESLPSVLQTLQQVQLHLSRCQALENPSSQKKQLPDTLRQIYIRILNQNVSYANSNIPSELTSVLSGLVLQANLPYPLRLLVADMLPKLLAQEPSFLSQPFRNFDVPIQQAFLHLLLAMGGDLTISAAVPTLSHLIAAQEAGIEFLTPPDIAEGCVPAIIRHSRQNSKTFQLRPMQGQYEQFLANASLIAAKPPGNTGPAY